jgi:ureidoglycolate dehydrogenase (NAD+)
MAGEIRVSAEALTAFMQRVFETLDVPPDDARKVAEGLAWASLRGIDSHGLIRLSSYVMRLDKGIVNPRPQMKIVKELPALAVLDADGAHGQVAVAAGMEKAMEMARRAGIGWVLVSGTKHTGAVGMYTRHAADAGMAGIYIGTSQPNMAYFGSRVGGVSTSPICISVPRAGGRSITVDISTAAAGVGKLMHHKATNTKLGEGWALDADGNPTTDPQKAELPMPLGGPKGAGLSLIFECLTTLMVGPSFIFRWLTGETRRHEQSCIVAAIDIAALTDVDRYREETEKLVQEIKGLPRAEGFDEILIPGERSDAIAAERARDGIPVPPKTWADAAKVAERLGVPMPETL